MTIKPFAIQGSTLSIGGVELQAGAAGGVVIPGVTQATSYSVEDVEKTGDTGSIPYSLVNGNPLAIDFVQLQILIDGGTIPTGWTDAPVYTVELDDEDIIDEIKVENGGNFAAAEATLMTEAAVMLIYTGAEADPLNATYNSADWTEVNFTPRTRAGEVENIGGGGGGDRLVNGDYEVVLGDSGLVTFPNVISITNAAPTEEDRYGGDINITGQRGYGNWQTDGSAGWGASVYLTAGDGGETEVSNAGGEGGEVRIRAGNGQAGENGGKVSLIAGDALWNNSGSAVHGGEARIKAGNATENADGFGVGGNVNISAGEGDQSNGSVYINTTGGDNTWTFDAAGVLTLPSGNTRIGNVFGADAIVGNTGTTVGILSQGTGGSTALQWVDDIENIETSTPVAAVVVNSPLAATSGTVQVLTGESDNGISSNVWEFDAAGVLHLPETGDIVDSNGDSVLGGGSTSLTDDGAVTITAGSTDHWIATQRREQNGSIPRGLRYDSDGSLYTIVRTWLNDEDDDLAVITKYTPSGAVSWQKTIPNVSPISLAVDSAKCAYVAVNYENAPVFYIFKFDTDGTELWKKSYTVNDGVVYDAFIEEKNSSSIVVACQKQTEGPDSVVVLDINSSTGAVNTQRELTQEGANVTVSGIDVTASQIVYVSGRYYDAGSSKYKMYITKLDSSLVEVWTKSIDNGSNYEMNSGDCASDELGNIYAVGFYEVNINNIDGNDSETAGILTKLNSAGVVQWTRRIGPGPCGTAIGGLTATPTGEVYLVSQTFEYKKNPNSDSDWDRFYMGDNRLIVAKYNTTGAVLWQRYADSNYKWEYSEDFRGQAVAVFGNRFAIDGYGYSSNITTTELESSADNESDYYVLQLPTDGTELTLSNFNFVESRVPARFITIAATTASSIVNSLYAATVTVATPTIVTDTAARIANEIFKSETYDYVFGADGTLTIPNDGDVRLTQSIVGFFAAIGGADGSDATMYGRTVVADSQGNVYVAGENNNTAQPFVMKFDPEGYRLWGVDIEDDTNENPGRANGLSIDPPTGNIVVTTEMYQGGLTYSEIVTIDQDTGRILSSERFSNIDSSVYLVDTAHTTLNGGDFAAAGSKEGAFSEEFSVVPQTGSGTGVITVLRSAIATPVGGTYWKIGGEGFSAFENVASVNYYPAITGTTRQGTGATFDIINNGNGTYSASVVSGGTNYRVGHKIKILGTALTGQENSTSYGAADNGGYGAWKLTDDTLGNTYLVILEPATSTTLTAQLAVGDTVLIDSLSPTTIAAALDVIPNDPFIGSYPNSRGYRLTDNFGTTGQPDINVGSVTTGNGTYAAGATPDNDIIITVDAADAGVITGVSNSGTAAGTSVATATALSGTNYQVGSGFSFDYYGPLRDSNYANYASWSVVNNGSNYVVGDVITVLGTSLGGATTANDMTITVDSVYDNAVTGVTFAGTSQTTYWKLTTTTQVDFLGAGAWTVKYPLSRECYLVTDDWERIFGTNTGDETDRLYAVSIDTSGNVIAVGEGYGAVNGSNYDLAVVYKFNATGTLQWARQVNEIDYNSIAMSVATIGTDIYVTHYTNGPGWTAITKLSADGTVQWQRYTGSSDDSIIAATGDGNILVAIEAFNDDINENAIKIFKMTPSGETIFKRWLYCGTDSYTNFKNGRGLVVEGDSFYITAYYDGNSGRPTLLARLPVDGSGVGEYSTFRYTDVNVTTSSFFGNTLTDINYDINEVDPVESYAGALAVAPYVNDTTEVTVTANAGDLYVNNCNPSTEIQQVRDTDGGRIVFADGTTQSTSATDIPQRVFRGERYTLGLRDRGHHIRCTYGNSWITIPYNSRVEFPIGTVITVVNDDTGTVAYIGSEGGGTSLYITGVGEAPFGVTLSNYGMATLLKVDKERWYISGNVEASGP